ncbi:MAG: YfiR family protein [Betaproteobacteria bacterium]|nr:MAG: YfiR family protein [Betaproteobacteria bacterium]
MIKRLLLAAALLTAASALAQADGAAETQIKAAFLYKFGGFVEWPMRAFQRPDSPFMIGVLGADAVAADLALVVAGRTVQGRPISVRKLKRGEPFASLHVLFVGQAEAARMAEILVAAKGQPLLIVTESEDALSHGSMINFVAVGDKVRFDVALPQAERGQLRISARLLAVARKVIPG